MVQINPTYPLPPAPIASFDFVDVAEGVGTVIYFGITSEDQSAVDYHLIPNSNAYSATIVTTHTSGAGTTEVDFDTGTFNFPRTVKGTCYVSLGFGNLDTNTTRIDAQLIHVTSGATETTLTSKIQSQSFTSAGGAQAEMAFFELPITTEKRVKKGEHLRLTVGIVASGTGTHYLGHDPKNRDNDPITAANGAATVLTVQIPFRIDI